MWNTQLFEVPCLIKHVANVCLSAATKKEAFRVTLGRLDRGIDSQIDRYLIKCKVLPFASVGGRSSKRKLSLHIYRNAEKRNLKLAPHCSVQHARRKGGINCAVAIHE